MSIEKIRLENLLKLIEKKFQSNLSQFAIAIDKKQPYINDIKHHRRPFTEKLARHIEERMELPVGFLDTGEDNVLQIQLPIYSIHLSAGSGSNIFEEEIKGYYPIDVDALKRYGWNSRDLCVFNVAGDSMAPTIADSQAVIVNTRERRIIDNKIFAISINNEVFIKRLFRDVLNNQVRIISDNTIYSEVVTKSEDFKIIGKVVYLLGRPI